MIKSSFIGRLGADAEPFGENDRFLSFRVATDDYDYKSGENTTVWINVRISADRIGKMKLTKGSLVFVTGTLRTSTYKSKVSGETVVSIDVAADSVNFVKGGGSGSTQAESTVAKHATEDSLKKELDDVTTGKFTKKEEAMTSPSTSEPDDDLPF